MERLAQLNKLRTINLKLLVIATVAISFGSLFNTAQIKQIVLPSNYQ
jgi:hypothetical protein